jgi:DtxR family Mn-dependent transcriptional regulator
MCLAEALGYSWDEVHEEATAGARDLRAVRGAHRGRARQPEHDPHGVSDPGPGWHAAAVRNVISLAEIRLNTPGTICQITDQTPDMLRYLADWA